MKIRNEFNDLCLELLGSKADPAPFKETWDDIASLARVFGKAAVLDAFREWAGTQTGQVIKYPVSDFNRVATGILNKLSVNRDPRLKDLVIDLTSASDSTVLFDGPQQIAIGMLLKEYEPSEILIAFRTFYAGVEGDAFLLKNAGKRFCETASALIETRRRAIRLQQETQQKIETLSAKRDLELAAEAAEEAAAEPEPEIDPLAD